MASRCGFENSNDVGVFANLTNAYCITALGAAENFYCEQHRHTCLGHAGPHWAVALAALGAQLRYGALHAPLGCARRIGRRPACLAAAAVPPACLPIPQTHPFTP